MKVPSPTTLAQRPSGGTLPLTVIFKTRVLCSHYLPPTVQDYDMDYDRSSLVLGGGGEVGFVLGREG